MYRMASKAKAPNKTIAKKATMPKGRLNSDAKHKKTQGLAVSYADQHEDGEEYLSYSVLDDFVICNRPWMASEGVCLSMISLRELIKDENIAKRFHGKISHEPIISCSEFSEYCESHIDDILDETHEFKNGEVSCRQVYVQFYDP